MTNGHFCLNIPENVLSQINAICSNLFLFLSFIKFLFYFLLSLIFHWEKSQNKCSWKSPFCSYLHASSHHDNFYLDNCNNLLTGLSICNLLSILCFALGEIPLDVRFHDVTLSLAGRALVQIVVSKVDPPIYLFHIFSSYNCTVDTCLCGEEVHILSPWIWEGLWSKHMQCCITSELGHKKLSRDSLLGSCLGIPEPKCKKLSTSEATM